MKFIESSNLIYFFEAFYISVRKHLYFDFISDAVLNAYDNDNDRNHMIINLRSDDAFEGLENMFCPKAIRPEAGHEKFIGI